MSIRYTASIELAGKVELSAPRKYLFSSRSEFRTRPPPGPLDPQTLPPPVARKGGEYSYLIVVKSKKGGVKCRLEAGPPGMKVTADGMLTWAVPADAADGERDVIITVSDGSGQEVFHTF